MIRPTRSHGQLRLPAKLLFHEVRLTCHAGGMETGATQAGFLLQKFACALNLLSGGQLDKQVRAREE
jgi:hypothetical protein